VRVKKLRSSVEVETFNKVCILTVHQIRLTKPRSNKTRSNRPLLRTIDTIAAVPKIGVVRIPAKVTAMLVARNPFTQKAKSNLSEKADTKGRANSATKKIPNPSIGPPKMHNIAAIANFDIFVFLFWLLFVLFMVFPVFTLFAMCHPERSEGS